MPELGGQSILSLHPEPTFYHDVYYIHPVLPVPFVNLISELPMGLRHGLPHVRQLDKIELQVTIQEFALFEARF